MEKNLKQLMLEDFCARIPYGVKATTKSGCWNEIYVVEGYRNDRIYLDCPVYDEGDDEWMVESVVPYLRPMSSMTEEEIEELKKLSSGIEWRIDVLHNIVLDIWYNTDSIDWLNKRMFDYRGLIPMGLALEAPEGMYNI